jgi:hypothetical protein
MMGWGVSMSGILVLSACRSGLRVAIWRVFGPFCRPFFVPWDEIKVQPRQVLFQKMARLGFGRPEAGVLSINSRAWDKLAAEARLPLGDPRVLPTESGGRFARSLFVQWLLMTSLAAAFFFIAPKLMSPNGAEGLPLATCILFPALFFGIAQIFRYVRER